MGVGEPAGQQVKGYNSARILIKMNEGHIHYIDWGMFGLESTNITVYTCYQSCPWRETASTSTFDNVQP